ncbi:MAG: hypothetical protein R3321_03925 [Nitrososphaeraceae archaeon]|nr:hypothetical protein [Nitrososphaeraceae archaeon]
MNRYTAISLSAIIIIIVVIAYSASSIFAANQIQFKSVDEEKFRFFDLVNKGKIDLCNPGPTFANFNEITLELIHDGKSIGKFSSQKIGLPPFSASQVQGKFTSERFEETQYLALHYDGMFSGSTPVRIDPTQLQVVSKITSNFLGVIPITISQDYSGLEFWEIMNNNEEYSCNSN